MSDSSSATSVVVGVDETPAAQRGVRYAAIEARRLGASLSIVHVAPGYAPGAGPPVVPEDVIKAHGVELLEHARKHAQASVPDLEVFTTLVAGQTTVHALADSSNDAALVVLGAERRSFASRVWTGDIVAGVAARSASPVAVVPPEWESAHEHGRVVVGVKDPDVAGGIVAAGLSLADELGAELVIMQAWKAPSGYDDLFANPTSADDYGRRVTAVLEPMVQVHRAEHRAVPVRIEVLHSQAAHALVSASADADRLLVSRPARGGTFHHLGYVGRAVLNESRCPVEVHPAGEPRTPES